MWNIFLKVASAIYRLAKAVSLLSRLRRRKKNGEDK